MQAVIYSKLRQKLKHQLDIASEQHEPVIVTRGDEKNVVILSLDDYNAMAETAYLLSTENNMKHLLASINQAKTGNVYKKELIEEQ